MKLDLENLSDNIVGNLIINKEAIEYDGCSYVFDDKKIIHRRAKITPTKTGQFVTLWKRDDEGVTCPLNYTEDFDFVVIICKKDELIGRFLFSKSLLTEQGYIRSENKEGKRGFRVYPDWDKTTSKQAVKTQLWQKRYFRRSMYLESDELY